MVQGKGGIIPLLRRTRETLDVTAVIYLSQYFIMPLNEK
jgi:hypothetical protein